VRVSIFSETRLRQAQPERFDIHVERIFPLTLSSSKGIFAFFDSLSREREQCSGASREGVSSVNNSSEFSARLRHAAGDERV
jgi:hypothetical protein